MNIGSARRLEEPEISLTSLIDVVFTLIIFFVVTTTFDDRSALQLQLPEASRQRVQQQAEPFVVVVDHEGRYFVGGNEVLKRDTDSLRESIGRVAGDDRERPIVLRADARSPYQAVITAMDALGQLGFSKVSLATSPSSEAGQGGADGE